MQAGSQVDCVPVTFVTIQNCLYVLCVFVNILCDSDMIIIVNFFSLYRPVWRHGLTEALSEPAIARRYIGGCKGGGAIVE